MSGAVLVFALVAVLVAIADFYIGEPRDRRLKDRLIDLYVAVDDGDWRSLYKYPATGLFEYMRRVLGKKVVSLRYVVSVALLSLAMTLVVYSFILCWSYALAYITEAKCPVPPLGQFLQIPMYMSVFIVHIVVINIVFDLFAWTVSRWGLKHLGTSGVTTSTLILVCVPLFAVGMVWTIYVFYLPLMIKLEANMRGFPFTWDHYFQILTANIPNITGLFHLPTHIFTIECRDPTHPVFSITAIGTMQILTLETLLPAILLFLATALGVFAVITQPLTRPILITTIERLEEHPKTIAFIVAAVLSSIAATIAAIQKYMGPS